MSTRLLNNLQIIFLLLFTTYSWEGLTANLELPYVSSSPIYQGEKGLVDLPEFRPAVRKMRVLIFPHTLKRDGRHGTPDDPKTVTFVSTQPMKLVGDSGITLNPSKFTLTVQKNEFVIETTTGDMAVEPGELKLTGSAPIQVERIVNMDKTHTYLGTFEIKKKTNGDIQVINLVDIETYLRGVVPSESLASWPIEALKAQAVAARTYALYHYTTAPNSRPYQVDDTARFQVYTGLDHVEDSTDRAIFETDSEVMMYNGKLIIAYFHSYSGGRTDSAKNIFKQNDAPYCAGNKEVFTRDELRANLPTSAHWIVEWTTDLWSSDFLIRKFKSSSRTGGKFSTFNNFGGLDFKILDWNFDFGSIKTIQAVQDKNVVSLDFTDLRSAIGWSKFPAYHFRLQKETNGFKFIGNGWGHHVGMSQWGAMMMAKYHGATHSDILHHYYTGIDIVKN